MIEVQRGSWPGWPDGVSLQLADDAAPWWLQAVHDFQVETGHVGQIILPAGALRLPAWVAEMQVGFDLHARGAAGWQAIYQKYNMLESSRARPSSTSPHLTGYCADAAGAVFLAWMVINGPRYGWKRTLVPEGDFPHFQWFPGTATAELTVTPLDPTEDDMAFPEFRIIIAKDGTALAANTAIYDGKFGPILFPGDDGGVLALKQSIADWHGITVDAVNAAFEPVSSVAVAQAYNAIAALRVGVDVGKLAAALAPLIGHDDTAALTTAVAAALAPQFAAVNANIDDQPTTFEITPKK